MLSSRSIKKIVVVSFLVLAFLSQSQPADARGFEGPRSHDFHNYPPHGRAYHSLPYGFFRLIIGGSNYYYYEGTYYQRSSDRYVVIPAPIGAVVTTIPAGYQPVIVDGVPYYTINGTTYMYTNYGYQVVPPPQVIIINKDLKSEQDAAFKKKVADQVKAEVGVPAKNTEESFTVNVPNSKGGYTAVALKRSGNGFVGPQGEYYTEFPKIEQLKVMYAK
ncbi:MAG: hypothetical protein COS99_05755 [Candidatus Omnitrophica bacterium CG07_land_8_20_14_0_80_42_15]|uniref:Uncharacterized protein n=1 Tax=Candidatus Aquitaenariimonas noxiae TaxID=1974741 RepID=A0A2J0KSJ3_9BACT|nr:MAG: hypothetical protein COS99_05755 [Candidatus Omnitrophica bacterium CG07_land_8_20_14_0_80_42_15]